MAIKNVLEAAGIHSSAVKGQKLEKQLLSKFSPRDEEYKKAVRALTEDEFECLAIYRSSVTLSISNFKDDDAASILPNSIERARKALKKETGR